MMLINSIDKSITKTKGKACIHNFNYQSDKLDRFPSADGLTHFNILYKTTYLA